VNRSSLPVLSGALAGVAAVSLGFGVVHGITLGFGTTLIGEAVDYSIYLFVQSRALATKNGVADADLQRAWVKEFWPTIRLGMLTSIVGFSSLLLSTFPGLSQLGLYSIAGLVVAAFFVDRLTTFVPAWLADPKDVRKRANDIDGLRWGWGAAIGALFVVITGLKGVNALTGLSVDAAADRALTVLAIAGGVKGLASVKDALNPPTAKAPVAEAPVAEAPATEEPAVESPGLKVFLVGAASLAVAAILAWVLKGDGNGLGLIAGENQNGTIALVLHFGPVLLAAVAIQQLVEHTFAAGLCGPGKKVVVGGVTVVLGVIAARMMDLHLLEALGFFGQGAPRDPSQPLRLAGSTGEQVFDTWTTGLVIAAGTAPLHDLGEALRAAKKK